MIPQLDTSSYISQLFWMLVSLAVLVLCFKLCIIPRMSRVKSARRLHVENLEADVSELESRISNVRSEAKLLHEDGMRKAAEIMADAQKEAYDALSSKLNAAREKSDMAIVAIKEKFRREFDHDISAKIDDAAGKVFNGLFGVLNEE